MQVIDFSRLFLDEYMKTDSLTFRTLHNSVYSFLGFTFPILFTIFITPIVVRRLGVVAYGVYILLTTVSAFLGVLDFGLGNALTRYIAVYVEKKDLERLSRFIGSARLLYTGIGLVGLGVFVAISQWFLYLFHIKTDVHASIPLLCLLAGLVFFTNSYFSVYAVVPTALQRFDVTVRLNVSQLLILQLATLFLVLGGYGLQAIMCANLIVALLSGGAFWYYAQRLLPRVRMRYLLDWEEVKIAYRFGFLSSLAALSINALTYLDRMIIPLFAGPAAVAYYTLPGNIALKIPGVTNSLTAMIFPMISSLQVSSNEHKVAEVYVKVFRNVTVVAAALTASIALFAEKLLLVWLGPDFAAKGYIVLVLLAFTNFGLALYTALYSFLLGLGRLRVLVVFSISVVLLNCILLFMLVPRQGIVGAAWAYFLSVLPVVLLFWWVEKKYLHLQHRVRFYGSLYLKVGTVLVVWWLGTAYFLLPLVHSMISLIIVGPASVLMFLLLYVLLGFLPTEDQQSFRSFFIAIKQKLLKPHVAS